MEDIKIQSEIIEADGRSLGFVKLDPSSGAWVPMELADQYQVISNFRLNAAAPEHVRSFFNGILTLYVYAWFYYPFYSMVHFQSNVLVEMALKARFPEFHNGKAGLRQLLKHAIDKGCIKDEGFPSLERRRKNEEATMASVSSITGENWPVTQDNFVDRLLKALPNSRNEFAHPRGHWIVTPGIAVDWLQISTEIVNQLW